ncbi:hypothetical protein COCON_G00182640 [Conger conger]|uniref:Uncharacterized protein n=1 Tax=Conger conger TaxID=82655 RepID=A0A9Q1D6Q4_CONCO|nr:hypothetical protein COCON_G00182640 [Conger conger]
MVLLAIEAGGGGWLPPYSTCTPPPTNPSIPTATAAAFFHCSLRANSHQYCCPPAAAGPPTPCRQPGTQSRQEKRTLKTPCISSVALPQNAVALLLALQHAGLHRCACARMRGQPLRPLTRRQGAHPDRRI